MRNRLKTDAPKMIVALKVTCVMNSLDQLDSSMFLSWENSDAVSIRVEIREI